jgi:hypothetical protein
MSNQTESSGCLLVFARIALVIISLTVFIPAGMLVWEIVSPDIERSMGTKCVFDEMYYDCKEIVGTSLLFKVDVGLQHIPSLEEKTDIYDTQVSFIYSSLGSESEENIAYVNNEVLSILFCNDNYESNCHSTTNSNDKHHDLVFSLERKYETTQATLVVIYKVSYCHELNQLEIYNWDYDFEDAYGSKTYLEEKYNDICKGKTGHSKESLEDLLLEFNVTYNELDNEDIWFVNKVVSDYVTYSGTSHFSEEDWGQYKVVDQRN